MKKALCVGINKYALPGNDLRFCVNDAQQMALFLVNNLGFAPADITVLLDEQATKAAIWVHLTALVEEAKGWDPNQIHYLVNTQSSHGTQFELADRVHEALCCHDTAALGDAWDPATIETDHEVHHLLETLPGNVRFELWFDACHAAGVREFGQRTKFMAPPSELPDAISTLWARLISTGYNQAVIWAACGANQTSADGYGRKPNGAFTGSFLANYRPGISRHILINLIKADLYQQNYDQVPLLECTTDLALKEMGE